MDHTSLVTQIKSNLITRGVNLSGVNACEITKRVAYALRGEGAGVYFKNYGNMSPEGYAVDIVMYPDGSYVDILGDAGGANTPSWGEAPDKLPLDKYRAILSDPDASLPSPDPLPIPPPPPSFDPQVLLDAIEASRKDINAHSDANRDQVLDAITKFRNDALTAIRTYGGAAAASGGLSGIFGGLFGKKG